MILADINDRSLPNSIDGDWLFVPSLRPKEVFPLFASSELGIDLGTMNVRLFSQTKGIVFDEPAAVAYNRQADKLMAIGQKAKQMIGKTPPHVGRRLAAWHRAMAEHGTARAGACRAQSG